LQVLPIKVVSVALRQQASCNQRDDAEEEEEEEVDEELDAEAKKIASDLSGLGRNSGSDLKAVQKFGAQNPKAVAAVVKDWINE
jgi:flagellar biosynthesis/type III secretory pathway M-ring protein FliF/YscJ